jgi:hypothetical protein
VLSTGDRERADDASPVALFAPSSCTDDGANEKNSRPPAKLEINSGKVRQIITHTRYLYYPPTPFCLRVLREAREKREERKRE